MTLSSADIELAERNLTAADKKLFAKFARRMFSSMKKELVRTGVIDPTGLGAKELDKKVADHILSLKGNWDLNVVIDHTSALLRNARQMVSREEFHLAVLFYATWLEHWLNHIVVHTITQQGNPQEAASRIIRGTSLEAKLQLVPVLLKGRPIPKRHQDKIIKVAELRNAFVHYKWKSQDVDSPAPQDEENALKDIAKTINYLTRYEHEYIYKQMKLRPRAVAGTPSKGPVLITKQSSLKS